MNTLVYLIPNSDEWNTDQVLGKRCTIRNGCAYVISDEKMNYPSKTLKEIIIEFGYNPFEQNGPLTEDQQLMLDINSNLEYLICLADLGLLGGDF